MVNICEIAIVRILLRIITSLRILSYDFSRVQNSNFTQVWNHKR